MPILVVTAVAAELEAVGVHDRIDVIAGGVGPAASAAAASAALLRGPYELVISAGIGGGFSPLRPGDLAVATSVIFADLGAQTPSGFQASSELGFGVEAYEPDQPAAARLARITGAHVGTVLTVATVTGTALTATTLAARHPGAVAEAMEGAGVAAAAALHDVPFAELRAISNPVGPRDRDAWRIEDALASLGAAFEAIAGQWWA
jgi:futalosine hydrolase